MLSGSQSQLIDVARTRADLNAQLAHHRERQVFHRDEAEKHDSEARKVEGLLAALDLLAVMANTEVVSSIVDGRDTSVLEGDQPVTATKKNGGGMTIQKAVSEVIDLMKDIETFDAPSVTSEVNSLFRDELAEEVGQNPVSTVLRRMAEKDQLVLVRKGGPRRAAVYGKPGYQGDIETKEEAKPTAISAI
jgi:hypothetical protein